MKWKSHRECAKAIAEDLGLDREKMLEGSVYPDKVGKAKSYVRIAKGVSIPVAHSEARICGVAITYPHHKETDQRIRKIMLRLRAEKLKAKELEPFILGCLSHLIQDRVVFPYDHPKFEKFERDIAKYKLKEEWRKEKVPLMDGAILKELPNILTLDNPNNPEAALKEGYQESLLILKSLLQDPCLPSKFTPIYEDCKKELIARKKTRYAYWLFTYLNPLALLNAIVDRKAIAEQNMVKKYGYVLKMELSGKE